MTVDQIFLKHAEMKIKFWIQEQEKQTKTASIEKMKQEQTVDELNFEGIC